MDEERQEKPVVKADNSWVCDVCNKDFSSGKALGGHRRIHLQKKMDSPKPKWRKSYPDGFDQCKVSKNEPICFACGRKFPSMKSLFGHMRSHPERGWRGIHPPCSKQSPPSSTVSDSNPVSPEANDQIASVFSSNSGSEPVTPDLSRSLSGWLVTARRGRKSLASSGHSGSDQDFESELVHEAFMMLADENRLHSSASKDQKSIAIHPTCSNFAVNEADFDQDNLTSCEVSAKIEHEQAEEEIDRPQEEQSAYTELMRKLKRRKKRRLRDLESISMFGNTLDKYKCTTCNKSFSTHQALGGHMSSHNKIKISNNTRADETVASGNTSTNRARSDGDNSEHARKEFKTSPAVGPLEAALSSVTSNNPSPSSMMSGKPLLFDLNELPPMDEDEERIEPEGVAVAPLAVYASA